MGNGNTPLTVAVALQRAAQMLRGHGDSPRLDAEILLGCVLGVSRSALIVRGADPRRPVPQGSLGHGELVGEGLLPHRRHSRAVRVAAS